jgi:hypothetical protein
LLAIHASDTVSETAIPRRGAVFAEIIGISLRELCASAWKFFLGKPKQLLRVFV